MNEVNYLRCRNVELETELRLVKEQLAQAHSGTQYLINCFTSAHMREQTATASGYDNTVHQIQAENAQLKRRLGLTQAGEKESNVNTELQSSHPNQTKHLQAPYYHTPHESQKENRPPEDYRVKDLLSFDADDSSLSAVKWQSPTDSFQSDPKLQSPLIDSSPITSITSVALDSKEASPGIGDSKAGNLGLGIRNIEGKPHSVRQSSPNLLEDSRPIQVNDEIHIEDTPKSATQWRAVRTPSPREPDVAFSLPFTHWEHKRLLDCGVFIEGWTGEQREEYWVQQGISHPRHSPKEWKLYYERVIRPQYLEKMKKREAALANTHSAGLIEAADRPRPSRDDEVCEGEHNFPEALQSQKAAEPLPSELQEPDNDINTDNMLNKSPVVDIDPRQPAAVELPPAPSPPVTQITGNLNNEYQNGSDNSLLNLQPPTESRPAKGLASPRWADDSPKISSSTSLPKLPASSATAEITTPSTANLQSAEDPKDEGPQNVSQLWATPDSIESTDRRILMISNIAAETTLAHILSQLRGGLVLSAKFVETAALKTRPPLGTNVVFVEFLNGLGARAAVEHWKKAHPIIPDDEVLSPTPIAELVRRPQNPPKEKFRENIEKYGLTRMIYIRDYAGKCTPEKALQEMRHCSYHLKRPIAFGERDDGLLFFEFADLTNARDAKRVIDRDYCCFHGMEMGYLPDPCCEMYEEVEVEEEEITAPEVKEEVKEGSEKVDIPGSSFEQVVEEA